MALVTPIGTTLGNRMSGSGARHDAHHPYHAFAEGIRHAPPVIPLRGGMTFEDQLRRAFAR